MNSRERTLLILLVAIVGGGAILFGGIFWFKRPLDAYNASIVKLKDELAAKQLEVETFQMQRQKLVVARAKSLPPNVAEATNVYQEYLRHVMTENGISVEDISPSQASKMKFLPTVPNIKEVGHQLMTYTVRARGELKHLIAAMEMIQATPYEHRIRSINVDRPDMVRDSKDTSPKLHINMVVETLLVGKSNAKTGLPPGFQARYVVLDSLAGLGGVPSGWGMLGNFVTIKTSMPTPERRSYYEIASKNMFTGPIPKIIIDYPPKPKVEIKTPPPPPPPLEPVGPYAPKYVYLTQTDPEQQTAYWKNRVFRGLEQKLIAKPNSGYQHFQVKDEVGEFVYVKAKVIRIDLRTVFFQKDRMIYAWHIGTTLEDALENEVDIDRRDILDLQIDEDYAKQSAAEQKAKTTPTSSKKTNTKGPTKGNPRSQ